MFYKMIENKCTQWYESERCTVKNLIEYIEKTGQMRDAQIEAIKVYLFLKIACECKPLTQLFRQGFFNSIDLNEIELSKSTREYLFQNPAAATLFEYACLTNDKGEQVSEKLEKQIKKDPTGIDYNEFFRNAFYGVSYTDYLFSLPMGAGKTYLMAAFIYLDLYFAYNEPTNPSFAHNFIIFAPSGLKSSVVPSLKTIQNFNPSWILPEPAATDIKRMISFEVLDQSKTAKKSNKTKNPNVQKIANHQPLSELFGLVAVTNAEKVILERIQEKQGQINMFEESEDDKDRQANELRNLIGKLPSLSIFIDEVHHAVTDLSMNVNNISIQVDDAEYGTEYATFNSWIYGIMRSGFGTPSMAELNAYTEQLKVVYEKITYEKGGSRYFSSKYNKKLVEANIRKAFCDKTDFNTTEELIPEEANLLNIANFTSEIYADNLDDYYPRQNVVENIMADDQGKLKVDKKTQQLIDLAIETGNDRIVLELQQRVSSHPNKNRSFHYLPYRTDSGFEQTFLREVLSFDIIEELGLEVYYNGDRAMTEFKIKCYKKTSGKWNYIGIYTPDFLIIKRKDGVIHKVIVVETKGQIYAKDPVFKDKKNFMETEFSKQNNAAYGYERFDYLYLEDTMPEKDRLTQTHQKICEFFKEKA